MFIQCTLFKEYTLDRMLTIKTLDFISFFEKIVNAMVDFESFGDGKTADHADHFLKGQKEEQKMIGQKIDHPTADSAQIFLDTLRAIHQEKSSVKPDSDKPKEFASGSEFLVRVNRIFDQVEKHPLTPSEIDEENAKPLTDNLRINHMINRDVEYDFLSVVCKTSAIKSRIREMTEENESDQQKQKNTMLEILLTKINSNDFSNEQFKEMGLSGGYLLCIPNYADEYTQEEVEGYIRDYPGMKDFIFTNYYIDKETGSLQKVSVMPRAVHQYDSRPALESAKSSSQRFVPMEMTAGDYELVGRTFDIIDNEMKNAPDPSTIQ
jgi:hypothetical protein